MLSAVITDNGKGGTFLTWTIYYLSGKNSYYHVKTDQTIDLINNPVNDTNAHKFQPNQIDRMFDFDQWFNTLISRSDNNIVYFHEFWDGRELDAIKQLKDKNVKSVVVINRSQNVLYDCAYRPRGRGLGKFSFKDYNLTYSNIDDYYNDFIKTFFEDSAKKWKELGLDNIWDDREFFALNFNPYKHEKIYDHIIEVKPDHFLLDSFEVWNYLDNVIKDVLEYLELPLDQKRFNLWKDVYQQWRQLHYKRQLFVWYFDIIINNIIYGVDQLLTRFDLDIIQEAAIQRELLYKHNLALKTHGITKFVNTVQLHNLLEPNIYHKL